MLDFEHHQLLSSFALKSFQIFSILFTPLLFDARYWIVHAIDYFQTSPCNATFFLIIFSQIFIEFEFSILELLCCCDCQGIKM
jgi:hypothetical protein